MKLWHQGLLVILILVAFMSCAKRLRKLLGMWSHTRSLEVCHWLENYRFEIFLSFSDFFSLLVFMNWPALSSCCQDEGFDVQTAGYGKLCCHRTNSLLSRFFVSTSKSSVLIWTMHHETTELCLFHFILVE